MIDADLKNAGILLTLHVAPELLDDQPLYQLDMADIPRPPVACASAYCTRTMRDVGIRDYLVSTNQWNGHGAAIVFDLAAIEQGTTNLRHSFLSILLHELAHALPARPKWPDVEPTDAQRKLQSRLYLDNVATPNAPVTDPDSPHGAAFIRRLCHLFYRSLSWGLFGDTMAMFNHWHYRTSALPSYVEACGAELQELHSHPFSNIEQTEPPEAFTRLWDLDLARIHAKDDDE